MKPFVMTEKRKKWILTTSLMAVLGFSLSAPLKREIGLAELASTTPDKIRKEVIVRNGEKYEIAFYESGDHTVALIPKTLEGKACDGEGCLSARALDEKFTADVKDLEIALDKSLKDVKPVAKQEAKAEEPRETEAEKRERLKEEKEKREQEKLEAARDKKDVDDRKALDNILKRCEYKDGKAHAACLAEKLVDLLKERARSAPKASGRDGKKLSNKIDPQLIEEFFRDNMREELLDIVKDPENGEATYAYKDLAAIVRELQSGLRDYKKVREMVKDVAVEATKFYAEQFKQDRSVADNKLSQSKMLKQQAASYNQQANATTDLNQKQVFMNNAFQLNQEAFKMEQEAMWLNSQGLNKQAWLTNELVPTFRDNTSFGLNTSVQMGTIDSSYATQLLAQMSQQTNALLLQLNTPTPTASTLAPNLRTDTQQRGSVTPGTTSFGTSRQFNPNLNRQ